MREEGACYVLLFSDDEGARVRDKGLKMEFERRV